MDMNCVFFISAERKVRKSRMAKKSFSIYRLTQAIAPFPTIPGYFFWGLIIGEHLNAFFFHNQWNAKVTYHTHSRLEHIDLVTGKLFKSFFLSRQFRLPSYFGLVFQKLLWSQEQYMLFKVHWPVNWCWKGLACFILCEGEHVGIT